MSKDRGGAAKWSREAAEQGVAPAQRNLGLCYGRGDGVAKDSVEAYKWLSLAHSQGYETARTDLGVLSRSITPEQIARGYRLARDFKPRKTPELTAFPFSEPAMP